MLTFEYDQETERKAMRLDGIQDGIAIGKQEGKWEGLQEGLQEGKREGKRDIIIQMINIGKSIDEISTFIGISKDELRQLIN